jgi:hypothetical protein
VIELSWKKKMTKDQSRDTGMAMVLLLLLLFLRTKREGYLVAAVAVHVLNMIAPKTFAPVAVLWMGFAHVLGEFMPKILLAILFFLVLTPIGLLRRLGGKDSLKLRAFKASEDSVAVVRNHLFTAQDLEKPY